MPQFIITYNQILNVLFFIVLIYVGKITVGVYIGEKVKRRVNPPKESAHGTEEKCGNCPAYVFAVNDFKKLSDRLGEGDKKFIDFGNKLETLTKSVNELTETIDKRRNEEVVQLRETVKEKKRKIEDLEKKLDESKRKHESD
jgi:predicted RNase H-like nuclease (RuvC/YqgF family)